MVLFEQLKLLHEQELYGSVTVLASMLLSVAERSPDVLTIPTLYQTYVYYGDALLNLKEYKRAELMLKKAIQMRRSKIKGKTQIFACGEVTSEVDVKYKAYLALGNQKQFKQATDLLETIPLKHRTISVHMALAKLHHKLGSVEKLAYSGYKEVLKQCPFALEAAKGLLCMGAKVAEVMSLMQCSALSAANVDWLSTWVKTQSHLCARDIPQATESFKILEMKTPLKDNVDVLVSMGEAYHINGDHQLAFSMFERVHALDPVNVKGMDIYASLLAREKKTKELEHLTARMIHANAAAAESWVAMGYFCYATKKGTKAVNFAQKALTINPTHVEALLLKGIVLLELKKYADSMNEFCAAFKIAPHRYEAHKGMVDVLMAQHRTREAVVVSNTACKHLGQSSRALTLCASVMLKDPLSADKAKPVLERALKQDPTYLNAVYLLASIYEQDRLYEKGIELLKKHAETSTTCRLHQMLGEFLSRTNEQEKALHHYSIALNMDPSNHKAAEATQRVEQNNPESSESFEVDDIPESDNEGDLEESEFDPVWSDVEFS